MDEPPVTAAEAARKAYVASTSPETTCLPPRGVGPRLFKRTLRKFGAATAAAAVTYTVSPKPTAPSPLESNEAVAPETAPKFVRGLLRPSVELATFLKAFVPVMTTSLMPTTLAGAAAQVAAPILTYTMSFR